MIGRALARGARDATRRPGLVALLWAWNLALAGLLLVPFWAWIYGASSTSPVTDALLDGLDIGVLTELLVNDGRVAAVLAAAVAGLAFLAIVSSAFVSGGLLEVVTAEGDGRPLLHRFFRGAGHFFGRFLRLLVLAGVTAVPIVALVGAAVSLAVSPLSSGGSERVAFWASMLSPAAVLLTLAYFIVVLDYARAATVLTGSRSMFGTWFRSLVFVLRRTAGTAGIAAAAALAVGLSIAAALAYDAVTNGRSWGLILGAIVVHEAMLFVRTAVRVGQVSAQAAYWAGLQPVAVTAAPVVVAAPLATESAAEVSVQSAAPPDEPAVQSE